MDTVILYVWDSDYYLAYQQEAQPDPMGKPGDILMPPNCTKVKPEFKEGYFYRWDPEAQVWIAEAKPKTAADFVGKQISHKSQTLHHIELRALLQAAVAADPEHYRVIRGTEEEGLWWGVEEIPEPTAEEKRIAELTSEIATLKSQLAATDYVAAKIAECAATTEEYADVLAQRQEWRDLINQYEAELAELQTSEE